MQVTVFTSTFDFPAIHVRLVHSGKIVRALVHSYDGWWEYRFQKNTVLGRWRIDHPNAVRQRRSRSSSS